MNSAQVSIQFCGGCNPRIDRGRIALELKRELEGLGFRISFNKPDSEFVIFLSGCMSSCAFKFNPRNPPYVTVAASTVDIDATDEARIVPEVLRKVKAYYERMETEIRKKDTECR
jgi:hypothetical protein